MPKATYYREAVESDVKAADDAGSLAARLRTMLFVAIALFGVVYLLSRSVDLSAFVTVGITGLSLYSNVVHERRLGDLRKRASKKDAIEVFEIECEKALEVEVAGDQAPALCFEVGPNEILMICGQWLLNNNIYRAPAVVDDGNQERFNLADDPFGFPCTKFRVHRWAGEKEPFWIEICGTYVEPSQTVVAVPRSAKLDKMQFFPGRLETLSSDIESYFE